MMEDAKEKMAAVREKKKLAPRGGSRKGIPNKATKELKDMVLGALADVGGQKYLATQALENPGAFMTLVGKCLPKDMTVTGANGGPIQISRIERVIVDDNNSI